MHIINSRLYSDSTLWFPILVWTMGTLGVSVGLILTIYLLRKYCGRNWGSCKTTRRMDGKVVMITGANSGIGKETAREMAKRGATVVMACRNRQLALEALRDIRTSTGDGELVLMDLDLGDLASVRNFCSNYKSKYKQLDILVNNAGVFMPPEDLQKTKNEFEVHIGVNHLGHFLLTHILLPIIQQTPKSRIVIVSSLLYKKGQIDFDNLQGDKGWDEKIKPNPLYSNSKLANIYHSQELHKRLSGTGVSVFVLCPGFIYTGLHRYTASKYSLLKKLCLAPIFFFIMRTAKQGAQTSLFCCLSEELDDLEWGFFRNCKLDHLDSIAQNSDISSKLWDVSMQLVGESQKENYSEIDGEL